MTEQIDPQGKTVAYAYDTTGALTDLTLPGGDTVGYSYEGCVAGIRFVDGGHGHPVEPAR